MILILLGLILFFASFSGNNPYIKRLSSLIRIAGLAAIALGVLISCAVQIDAGTVGVKKLFGKVQNDVLNSGLHFINPLMEVEHFDIKTHNYTMSGMHDEGTKSG